MLDFTSSLYLGLCHPSPSLGSWSGLTTGKPAALQSPPRSVAVAGRFAAMVGCENASPVASTLHLFWDLFGIFATDRVRIYMDQGTYAIARWGVERAAARGIPVSVNIAPLILVARSLSRMPSALATASRLAFMCGGACRRPQLPCRQRGSKRAS